MASMHDVRLEYGKLGSWSLDFLSATHSLSLSNLGCQAHQTTYHVVLLFQNLEHSYLQPNVRLTNS
jgi:hypothetical protein